MPNPFDTVVGAMIVLAAFIDVTEHAYRARCVARRGLVYCYFRICSGCRFLFGCGSRLVKAWNSAYLSGVTCNGRYCHDSLGHVWADPDYASEVSNELTRFVRHHRHHSTAADPEDRPAP